MDILFLVVGIFIGLLVSFIYIRMKLQKQRAEFELEKRSVDQVFVQQKFELEKEKSLFEDRYLSLLKEKDALLLQIQLIRSESNLQSQQLARAEAYFGNLQEMKGAKGDRLSERSTLALYSVGFLV